jgi:hypothetical protein
LAIDVAMAMAQKYAVAGDTELQQAISQILASYNGLDPDFVDLWKTSNSIVPDPNHDYSVYKHNVELICPEMMRLFSTAYLSDL